MKFSYIRATRPALAALLLSATCLTVASQAAKAATPCPAPADGEITVSTAVNETCYIDGANALTVVDGGSIQDATAIRVNDGEAAGHITLMEGGNINGSLITIGEMLGNYYVSGQHDGIMTNVDIYGSFGGVTVEETGTIENTGNSSAILVRNAASLGYINNQGTIRGGDVNFAISSQGQIGQISNYGLIDGGEGGIDITGTQTGDIYNYGQISMRGTADIFGGVLSFNGMADSSDVHVYNYGLLDGPISRIGDAKLYLLGDGTDNAYNGELRITGTVEGGANSHIYVGYAEDAASFSIEKDWNVGGVTVRNGSTLNMGDVLASITATAVTNHGTIDVGLLHQQINGDYQQTGGRLIIGAVDLDDYGRLIVNGAAGFDETSSLYVDVRINAIDFAASDRLLNVVSATNGINIEGELDITSNSFLYNFGYELDGDNLHILFGLDDEKSISQSVNNKNNNAGKNAAKVLDHIMSNNPGGNFDDVVNAFGNLTSEEEISDAVTQILPVITGGTTQAALNTMNTTGRIVQARQEGNQGLSSGDGIVSSGNYWLKPFGSWARHDSQGGTPGFKSDGYGIIGGVDGLVSDHTRLGVALSYADTTVKGLRAASTQKVNVDNYHATLYGSHSLSDKTELNARIGGGMSRNEGRSVINFGGANTVARSDYDGYNFEASAGVGHTVPLNGTTTITPSARVDYLYAYNESYTQTGAGGFNQNVSSQSSDQLIPTLDAKLHHRFTEGFSSAINLGIGYDLLNDRNQVTSQFVGGGAAFVTQGLDPSPWVGHAGAGLTFNPGDNIELSARYDAEVRGSDYLNQSVSLKIRSAF